MRIGSRDGLVMPVVRIVRCDVGATLGVQVRAVAAMGAVEQLHPGGCRLKKDTLHDRASRSRGALDLDSVRPRRHCVRNGAPGLFGAGRVDRPDNRAVDEDVRGPAEKHGARVEDRDLGGLLGRVGEGVVDTESDRLHPQPIKRLGRRGRTSERRVGHDERVSRDCRPIAVAGVSGPVGRSQCR